MTLATVRALVRFVFVSVGWTAWEQEDNSLLIKDNHDVCWRVTVERMP